MSEPAERLEQAGEMESRMSAAEHIARIIGEFVFFKASPHVILSRPGGHAQARPR